jgi:hypothetical protein
MDECQTMYSLLEAFKKRIKELEKENKRLKKHFRAVSAECDYYKTKLIVSGHELDY